MMPSKSASAFEGASRAPLRVGLALMTGVEIVGQTMDLHSQMVNSLYVSGKGPLLRFVPPNAFVLASVLAVGLAGLFAFARDRRPIVGGLATLACMALLSEWITERFGSTPHNMFYPGGMLLGWIAGLWYARLAAREGLGGVDREQLAEAGAIGVLAALYVGSGVSKVLNGGIGWADLTTMRSTILAQQCLGGWTWVEAYRSAIVEHPRLAQSLAAGALGIELGGFLLLVNRSLRIVWGLLILGLHVNILLLCTIPYVEPMVLVPLFTLPWPALLGRLGRRRLTDTAVASPPDAPAITEVPVPTAMVALVLVLLALSLLVRLAS
jgi:hypothetical protein